MAYSIKPSKNQDYIVLKVVGNFKGQDMMKYIIESHALGKDLGINRYLVDVTEATNIDSLASNYNFAHADFRKVEGIDIKARVAAIVSQGDHSHDFIETVLCNAGLPLKLFNDLDKALEYLLDNKSSDNSAE